MFSFNELLLEIKNVMGKSYGDLKQNLGAQKELFQKHFSKIPKELPLMRQAMIKQYSKSVKDQVGRAQDGTIYNFKTFARDRGNLSSPEELDHTVRKQLTDLNGTQTKQDLLQNYRYKPNFLERTGDKIRSKIPFLSEPDTRVTKDLPFYYGPNIRKGMKDFKDGFNKQYDKAKTRRDEYEANRQPRDVEHKVYSASNTPIVLGAANDIRALPPGNPPVNSNKTTDPPVAPLIRPNGSLWMDRVDSSLRKKKKDVENV